LHISIKMKKEIFHKVKIPEDIELEVKDNKVTIKKGEIKNEREFNLQGISLEKIKDELIIGSEKCSKKEKRNINTIASHIKNMIKGFEKPFEYHLKVCFNHFPITVEVKGQEILIKNFLGERHPRKITFDKRANVKVEKEFITVTSYDKEIAGQTAANLEMITRIPNRDRRIFQDGIFIINKNGKQM